MLSVARAAALAAVLRLFVDDDLARGVTAQERDYCAGCQGPRPAPGFIAYGTHRLCHACATEYEVARLRGTVTTLGQFLRDKAFGEGETYAVATASD